MDEKTIVARAQALVQTMSTPGWGIVQEVALSAIRAAEERVMECEDAVQTRGLLFKAKAAREFFRDFQNALELTKAAVTKHNDFIKVTNEVQVPE